MKAVEGKNWCAIDTINSKRLIEYAANKCKLLYLQPKLTETDALSVLVDTLDSHAEFKGFTERTIRNIIPKISLIYIPEFTDKIDDKYTVIHKYNSLNSKDNKNLHNHKSQTINAPIEIDTNVKGLFRFSREEKKTISKERAEKCANAAKALGIDYDDESGNITYSDESFFDINDKNKDINAIFHPFYQLEYRIFGIIRYIQVNAETGETSFINREDLMDESLFYERKHHLKNRRSMLIFVLTLRMFFVSFAIISGLCLIVSKFASTMEGSFFVGGLLIAIYVFWLSIDTAAFKIRGYKKISITQIMDILSHNMQIRMPLFRVLFCVFLYSFGIIMLIIALALIL
ncbi:MAG: hypothetical protein RR054_00395 [Clostridia bacterium]